MIEKFLNSPIIHSSMIFWVGWIILPILLEFVPAIGNFFILLGKKIRLSKDTKELDFLPQISILIPIYNSANTLYECLKSINNSTYPNENTIPHSVPLFFSGTTYET